MLVSAAEDGNSLGPKKSVDGASFNVFTGDFLGLPQVDVENEMSARCGLHCSLITAGGALFCVAAPSTTMMVYLPRGGS